MIMLLCSGCGKSLSKAGGRKSPVNLQHSFALIDSVVVDGDILHYYSIYADAPSYEPVIAKDEGITCVDDVGRFMEILETEILVYRQMQLVHYAEGMTRFLLAMTTEEGLWYNFMFPDGRINKEHKNSVASFSWWAVRGVRGLAAANNILEQTGSNPELLKLVRTSLDASLSHLPEFLDNYPGTIDTDLGKRPLWILEGDPDKSSELLLALTKLHRSCDYDLHDEIQKLAEGLTAHQYMEASSEFYGMYFCWNNLWHAWGNNHAYALLEAYSITGDAQFLESVKLWADFFVPYLLKNSFPRRIIIQDAENAEVFDFPQIAYGINSTYQGIHELAELTGDKRYKAYAEQVFAWFKGKNQAGKVMYDEQTGRGYDGINNKDSVNMNSGAESTIESLLAIQARGKF